VILHNIPELISGLQIGPDSLPSSVLQIAFHSRRRHHGVGGIHREVRKSSKSRSRQMFESEGHLKLQALDYKLAQAHVLTRSKGKYLTYETGRLTGLLVLICKHTTSLTPNV
jgi:hypothetical protein